MTFSRKIALVLYDLMSVCVIAGILACAWPQVAFAYVDPSVMTYTIQALAGVAVALSAVAGVAMRRGKKHLMAILDIDENARRELEKDVSRTKISPYVAEALGAEQPCEQEGAYDDAYVLETRSADAVEGPDETAEASEPSDAGQALQETKEKSKKLSGFLDSSSFAPSWRQRFGIAVLVSAFTVCTIFVVAPYEIVGNAIGSLVYTLADVWWVVLPPIAGIILVLSLLLSALRGRAYSVALLVVFALGLCSYIQALVLNWGLPPADGGTIMWADYMPQQIVSTTVWLAVLGLAVVFALHKRKRAQGVAAITSAFLLIVQFIGVLSLVIVPPAATTDDAVGDALNSNLISETEIVMTEDQLYTVNPNKNVIVFVLDTYDTAYLKRIQRDFNADVLDGFDGFTNYENCTGCLIPTRFAVPQILTGEMPHRDEKFSTYKAERYARSTFLTDIYDANYSMGLYTDALTIGRLSEEEQYGITSKTVNMHKLTNSALNYWGTLVAMGQMGLYRDVPWPLKWVFWYYTDQINTDMVIYDPAAPPEETIYVMDDIRYYNRLCDIGLSIEEPKEDGTTYDGGFRFIHLLGAHYPFSYDEEVNDLGTDNSNVFKQAQGALHIVKEYMRQLKELGLYDSTTIIVTADHGYWTLTMEPIDTTSTPIMFIKPAQSADLDALPMVTDEKPVSQFDLQATIMDAMGLDYSKYSEKEEYEGYSMLRDIPDDRVRLYVTTDSEGLQEMRFREYVIDGNALDFDNWEETGWFWQNE